MYWLRSGSYFDLALFLVMCVLWSLGGWLLVTHSFRLKSTERLLVGWATGLLLFIGLSNLLANVLPVAAAFWAASIFILAAGLAVAWRSGRRAWLHPGDLRAWPQFVALGAAVFLFTMIGRGLAVFDDYLHIPLISVMAAGDMPPHFYLNPDMQFAYHYGLQIFAASMVRSGGFLPWSAWDVSKALVIALTLLLSWLWVRRVTRSEGAAYLGSLLVTFGGGARWLLLLVPLSLLLRISSAVPLANTGLDAGPDLFTALSHPWPVEGGGPFPFPFAFHNGIFSPVLFALNASGALPFATVILLLLLTNRRRFSTAAVPVLAVIFATLALSAEHLFVFLWAGVALAGLIYLLLQRRRGRPVERGILTQWAAILLISGVLSVVQGAFITEAVRNVLLRIQGVESTTGGTYDYFEFVPNWPPSLVSAHLGRLSLLNPLQLIALLAEMGPAVLLAPAATWFAMWRLRRRDWLLAGLGLGAAISFLLPIFFLYGVERSSTRLPATALWIWVLLGFPLAWRAFQRGRKLPRLLLGFSYAASIFGGAVVLAVQMTTIAAPQMTYYINGYDARLAWEYWNRLPAGAQVLDPVSERSVALFGRAARSNIDFYHYLPEWSALVNDPNPVTAARAGFSFVYIDSDWWYEMTPEQQQAFDNPCVKRVAEQNPADEDFRWLLDVADCG